MNSPEEQTFDSKNTAAELPVFSVKLQFRILRSLLPKCFQHFDSCSMGVTNHTEVRMTPQQFIIISTVAKYNPPAHTKDMIDL